MKSQFQQVNDPSDFWKIIKRQGIGKQKSSDEDDLDVDVDGLNEYFCTLGTQQAIDSELIPFYENLVEHARPTFKFLPVTSEAIMRAIKGISSNAMGPDGISCILIKIISEKLAVICAHIFNYSIENNRYPTRWKDSYVLPLKKKNPALNFCDLRPITLISVLAKIFDKVMYHQFSEFVEGNNLIDTYQSGYRENHSIQTALIDVTDNVRKAMDDSKLTVFGSLDLSCAFNSVDHELILSILKSIGCEDSVLSWFRSYLANRRQRVRLKSGNMSSWAELTRGTPQGTTFSALIFCLYINKISTVIEKCRRSGYADDFNVYITCKREDLGSAVSSMNGDLANLSLWFKRHGLVLNPKKCCAMIMGHPRLLACTSIDDAPKVMIDEQEIDYVNHIRSLGIILQDNLSWSIQTDKIVARIHSMLYAFRNLLCSRSAVLKTTLVKTFILPQINYGAAIMSDLNSICRLRIQRALNSCIRFILNLKYDDRIYDKYKKLKILKIDELIQYCILGTMFKVITAGKPAYLADQYVQFSQIHTVDTRNRISSYRIPLARTTAYKQSFAIQSILFYNGLSTELKQLRNIVSFNTFNAYQNSKVCSQY